MRTTAAVRGMVIVLASMCAAAQAGTVYISTLGNDTNTGQSWAAAKKTVQAGLNAAVSGDQVWVAAGTYVQCITLKAGVALYGGFAGTETDLSQRNWKTNVTILDGNQAGSAVTGPSGATATTRIDGFTIRNGMVNGAGGGVYLYDSSPMIANNTITGNGAHYGGGLYLSSSASMLINNTISGNGARYGGGLGMEYSSPIIANNTITGNSASDGGGLYLEYGSSPTVTNTIVAFNSSGIYRSGTSGTPVLRYNCVYGNTAYNYASLDDATGADGNIKADPKLAGVAYSNLHIQPDSPCRDAGNDADVQPGWLDMDGQPRQIGRVDIGADESDDTTWPPGSYVVVRVSPTGNDGNDGSSWALAKRTVQAGINAAAALGGEVWVATGTYPERVTLRPYAHVYGGFTGSETQRDQRNWVANATILDGLHSGSVVTGLAGHQVSTIDGFTITNGSGQAFGSDTIGGGLYLDYSSPMIANNTISGNSASYSGGGLYLYWCSPTIINNTISGNTATVGGGLYLDYSSPTIANNTITGNSATGGYGDGGGLYLDYSCPMIANNTISENDGGGLYLTHSCPTITGNTISGNSSLYLGGLWLHYSSPTITNNTISGNAMGYGDGGGLRLQHSSPTIANNTITGNSAPGSGGLYLSYSSPTITNTIVAFNSSGIYRGDPDSTPALRYNCVFGNTGYDYYGLTDPTNTNGNISANPLFVVSPSPGLDGKWGTADDILGDVHLFSSSPCINAGDPAYLPTAGETDVDGQPRKIGARVDIGADEYCLTGDANHDGYVNVGDLQLLVAAWGTRKGDASYNADADVNGDGFVNIGDLQSLAANWGKSV